MITWMQQHRKYLIVTIWISTIAFVGAGFVGWGQYSYGDKSNAIAKVGEVKVTQRELQQVYSQLFNQYSEMFQGKFDQEQAKNFGLQQQALTQLINTTYIVNLAKTFGLQVSDTEVYETLKTQEVFFKNGAFDKDVYKDILSKNRLIPSDYEADLKKGLLVQKILKLLEPTVSDLEKQSVNAAMYIADKIKYDVIDPSTFSITSSEEELKAYYETVKENFKTLPAYELELITQENITQSYTESELQEYFNAHKHNFKNSDGKIMKFNAAKVAVENALNDKASKKAALKTYIAYKKNELDASIKKETRKVNQMSADFSREIFAEVLKLTPKAPYLKPRKLNNNYVVIKLVSTIPSKVKTFDVARDEVSQAFNAQKREQQVMEFANKSINTFKGDTTAFITREDVESLKKLDDMESAEFLNQLFEQQNKQGYIILKNKKVVLFNILEQKLLQKENEQAEALVTRLKQNLLNQGLIKLLQSKYPTEMFVKGI